MVKIINESAKRDPESTWEDVIVDKVERLQEVFDMDWFDIRELKEELENSGWFDVSTSKLWRDVKELYDTMICNNHRIVLAGDNIDINEIRDHCKGIKAAPGRNY